MPNSRLRHGRRSAWPLLLTIIGAALASGQHLLRAIAQRADEHASEGSALLVLPPGRVPSAATLRRAVSAVDLGARGAHGGLRGVPAGATEAGAEDGFAIIVKDDTGKAVEHLLAKQSSTHWRFGAQARLVRGQGVTSDTGQNNAWIELQIRTGTLIVSVIWTNWASFTETATPAATPVAPGDYTVVRLGQMLLDRAASVRAGRTPAPGLSNRALRLTREAAVSTFDEYVRLDGQDIPLFNEPPQGMTGRGADYSHAIDV